jgi:hypothetical protein
MWTDRQSRKQNKRRAIAVEHLVNLPPGVPATPTERGFETCPCPTDCALRGSCHLCVAYHGRKHRLPYCER